MGKLEPDYTWNKKRYGFGCLDCAYDNANETNMLMHCRAKKHGIRLDQAESIDTYVKSQNGNGLKSVIITLCYLCWNTRDISVEGVLALRDEAERLIKLGNFPMICVVDNGSDDGTAYAIRKAFGDDMPHYIHITRLEKNSGISEARNVMVDFAKAQGSKYILFMDGDIEVVPLSVYTMVRYLECHPDVGVIGAYSSNCSEKRSDCAALWTEIAESRVRNDIPVAWTQYGLFRGDMFHKGMRFDASGPFGKPGWGFEDDDLHFQIIQAGYKNRYFGGMCYLHRALHSSWDHIEAGGISVEEMFYARQNYLIAKWSKLGVDAGILKRVGAQRLPRL
jgi:glycosyltransferase involved in cell wall biosynthesis